MSHRLLVSAPAALITSERMRPLAEHVLRYLAKKDIPAAVVKIDEKIFADGEYYPRISESIRNMTVYLFFSPDYPNPTEGIGRLGILLNALNHASPDQVKCILPYIPYFRQDRKAEPRTPISAQFVAKIIQMYPTMTRNLITMDMHAEQVQGFFDIPTENLYGRKILAEYLRKKFKGQYDQIVIVAPDVNSAKRAQDFAQSIDLSIPYCIVDKRRPRANHSEVVSFVGGDVKGLCAIAVDDMIDTGGTMIGACNELRRRGASSFIACATHGVFSAKSEDSIPSTEERLRQHEIRVITTNSIPRSPEYVEANQSWLTILPINDMIAEAVAADCLYGGSISVLNKK